MNSIPDELVITCNEIIETVAIFYNDSTKTTPVNLNEKKTACKSGNFYLLFAFLSITISLLIIVSVCYCYYHIRNRAKQKHKLPYYHTINKF